MPKPKGPYAKGMAKLFFGQMVLEAWGINAKTTFVSGTCVICWPCYPRPQASNNTWPTNPFGILLGVDHKSSLFEQSLVETPRFINSVSRQAVEYPAADVVVCLEPNFAHPGAMRSWPKEARGQSFRLSAHGEFAGWW